MLPIVPVPLAQELLPVQTSCLQVPSMPARAFQTTSQESQKQRQRVESTAKAAKETSQRHRRAHSDPRFARPMCNARLSREILRHSTRMTFSCHRTKTNQNGIEQITGIESTTTTENPRTVAGNATRSVRISLYYLVDAMRGPWSLAGCLAQQGRLTPRRIFHLAQALRNTIG